MLAFSEAGLTFASAAVFPEVAVTTLILRQGKLTKRHFYSLYYSHPTSPYHSDNVNRPHTLVYNPFYFMVNTAVPLT